ncbi:hypothetical protein TNCV_3637291 [Trichonephila clavipes]|nr:hypothetical protein TNCV_3637291 [Trichonephila clavipes]
MERDRVKWIKIVINDRDSLPQMDLESNKSHKVNMYKAQSCLAPPRVPGVYVMPLQCTYTLQDALFIRYKQSPDNTRSVVFSQRANSPRLIEDETLNDCGIINNLIDYVDGHKNRIL